MKSIGVVGRFYKEGDVVPGDLERAFNYYRQCAEGRDFRGMFHYGRLLLAQNHVDEALRWLKRVPVTATPTFLRTAHDMLRKTGVEQVAHLYADYISQT